MLSPNFQVANFEVEEYNCQPISISYKFKGTDKVVTKQLFNVGSSFPSTKSVTFENKLGNVDLMVHYADDAHVMKGLPSQISQYDIGEGKKDEKTEKTSFTMRVSNNIHNVACLDEVEFIQEWTETEKIPIKNTPVPVVEPKKEEVVEKTEEEKKAQKKKEKRDKAAKNKEGADAKPEEEEKEEPIPEVVEQ